jgi:hypothetical protein
MSQWTVSTYQTTKSSTGENRQAFMYLSRQIPALHEKKFLMLKETPMWRLNTELNTRYSSFVYG